MRRNKKTAGIGFSLGFERAAMHCGVLNKIVVYAILRIGTTADRPGDSDLICNGSDLCGCAGTGLAILKTDLMAAIGCPLREMPGIRRDK